jgi:hypothetical protein
VEDLSFMVISWRLRGEGHRRVAGNESSRGCFINNSSGRGWLLLNPSFSSLLVCTTPMFGIGRMAGEKILLQVVFSFEPLGFDSEGINVSECQTRFLLL